MNYLSRNSRFHGFGAVGVCGILLIGGCTWPKGHVSYGQFDQAFPKVREQAKQVQEQYPELFTYLVKHDAATQKIARAYLGAIPDPDAVPIIKDPFIDAVVVVIKPQMDCTACEQDCNNGFLAASSWWRGFCERTNVVLCDICENGLFLVRGSLLDLVGGSPVEGGPQPEPPT